jgi:exodeoxyribonuclease V gamma subunit
MAGPRAAPVADDATAVRHHVRTMPTRDAAQFTLVSGNRLDRLADFLAERLAQPAGADALVPETILVPQPTLRRWLQQQLALRHGIAANLDFATPSEFVWRLLRAGRPDLPKDSPWERERLRWRLYALLGGAALPPAVAAHLARAGGSTSSEGRALARYRLADALAAAFDKYQAYRRDWLERWERGADQDDWQAELWRRLQPAAGLPHRAALIGDWLRRFDGSGTSPPGLPPRLSAFGTIHVSPDVLRMLGVVAQTRALDFHLPTPCREYWGDVESLRERLRRDGPEALPDALAALQDDNPLLVAWGAAGRDIAAQLFSYDTVTPARELDLSLAPAPDTLLHRIQADVLDRRAPVPAAVADDDLSLQVHACHSRLREVEVLHDRLRALLDDDPGLQPRDIAVLAPDIAAYLPLVRAVFDGIPVGDPRHIPFSLADRPQAQSHPLATLFLALLDLPQSRFTATELHDVLAVPAVMRAHDLDAAALERIERWGDGAGLRWGEDEDARVRAGVGRWREHSLAFGLDRLLLGYATGDDAQAGDVAGYPELEGADAERLDALLSVVARLRALAAWMREPHAAREWQQRLAQDFIALLAASPADEAEAQARRMVTDALDAFAHEAGEAGDLPASLVQAALSERLSQPSRHQAWLGGGVTFAGMVPLRTVPFRVVCLLGMEADAYPRREAGSDVNRLVDALAGRAPRRLGDRSVRDDDRFLFLQLLCAAGDVFYLSYGGRDARDGSVREPSALVSELLDTVQRYLPDGAGAQAHCVIEHPLQPFSPQAFGALAPGERVARRFSYRGEWRATASEDRLQAEPAFLAAAVAATSGEDAVALPDRDALQQFFRNPARAFLRDRLGLWLPSAEDADHDREPLGADGLVRYKAADALLEQRDWTARDLRARGFLPPGEDGEALAREARRIADCVAAARDAAHGKGAATVVEARDGIAFRFDDVVAGARVVADPGKLNGKRRLRTGLDHLLLASVVGAGAKTTLIGFEEDRKTGEIRATAQVHAGVEAAAARDALQALLALWHEGRRQPLPFSAKCAATYVDALRKHDDEARAWDAAAKEFSPFGLANRECDDPWLQLAFRPYGLFAAFDAPCAVRFRAVARQVFDAVEPTP